MANFYYVKSGGTATGDAGRVATTRSTGSFATKGASAYYDNIIAALAATTTPVSADEILVSDLHSHDYGASDTTYVGPATGAVLKFVSVSDTALDQSSIGSPLAKEFGNVDMIFNGLFSIAGIEIESGDDLDWLLQTSVYLVDSRLTATGSGDHPIRIFADGCSATLVNTDLEFGNNSANLRLSGGGFTNIFGGAIVGSATAITEFLDDRSLEIGGHNLDITGFDMTNVTGIIVRAIDIDVDTFLVTIDGCKLNSAVTLASGAFLLNGQKLLVTRSSDDSDIAEHQLFQRTVEGDVEDATNIFRDESQAFPGGDKVSIKALPATLVSSLQPLTFDFPAQFIELSSASSDVLTIHFAVVDTVTLTDVNVWAALIYPDGTNKQTPIYLSNQNADILAAGTEHTDDSGSSTWKDGASDLTGFNEYRMTLDTSGDAGADSVPILRIHVGIDADVYFDSEVTLG